MKLFTLPGKYQPSALLLLLLFTTATACAQLQADFIADKTGGCSPLIVSFTNTTQNASPGAAYTWDFGNGNSSAIKNPSATFYAEQSYTITLTVKDGTQTSVKTKTVTVYKKPIPDFTVSENKGCLPFMPAFNSTSVAGDGTISSLYWDFGDGNTQQSYSQQVNHIYNFAQTASVTLTVANNYGCTNTIRKKDIVNVLPATQASFSAEKTIYCEVTDEVRFTNNSSGPGTLSYEWDFGDGTTSALKAPSHIYNKKGTYTVKLAVKSSEGCSDILTRTAYLNIADFNSDFQPPSLICINTAVTFNNISSPVPSQSNWYIDEDYFYSNYGNGSAYTYIGTAGTHTVKLINTFGECRETVTKQIEANPAFNVQGFVADVTGQCGSPVKVNFKDTTAGAVKWKWDFGYYTSAADVKEPSYTYTRDDNYYVTLTVSNSAGCSGTVSKNVYISKPLVGIYLKNYPDYLYTSSCDTLRAEFTSRSTEEIAKFVWDFGDGTPVSEEKEPIHIYRTRGYFKPKLTYTTVNGCTGSVEYPGVQVYSQPKADFTVEPAVCGNSYVYFTNTSTGDFTFFSWDFGDNTGTQYDNPHRYQKEGEYNVTLIATNGYCSDTIKKNSIIKVSPPFPKIGSVTNTCDGTRGLVTITDETSRAGKWTWDFGDGTTMSYTSYQPSITHTYNQSGTYKVVLTAEGGCVLKDSTLAFVLLKQKPVLTADNEVACINAPLSIHVRGLDYSTYILSDPADRYHFKKMEYSDGSVFNGDFSNANVYGYRYSWYQDLDATIIPNEIKDDKLRMIMTSYFFNCEDTTNFVPIKTKGVKAGFEVVTDNICFKSPVSLKDTSRTTAGSVISSWEWNFGDGTTQTITQPGSVNHRYPAPGNYYVILKISDSDGCNASATTPQPVSVNGPKAAFSMSTGNTVELNTSIIFYNNTNNFNSFNTGYKWDFGDGQTSTAYSPAHTYVTEGIYKIQLIATNSQTQCSDTASQTITVRNFNYAFSMNASFIGNNGKCAPALARFTNTSSGYTRVVWDFGDGSILENQNYPTHIYKDPGKYIVTLYVYGYNGLTGTFKDSINISSSSANIKADVLEGCKGLQVTLNAPAHANSVSYAWDFGDGNVISTTDSFAVSKYMDAGTYAASLIAVDANGCSTPVTLADKIKIYPDPEVSISPANPVLCKGKSVQLKASGAAGYTWSPAEGLDNVNTSSPVASPASTITYTVNAVNEKGCKGSNDVIVTVALPFTIQSSPDAAICAGNTVQLNATGADGYQWINETAGLSNTQIANPVVTPSATSVYTVVGYDQYQCFTDTGFVKVTVYPLPTVNAGADKEVIIGTELQLNPVASNDVINWSWSPADYLSCADCSSPVSKPRSPVEYIVTVLNQHNCIAKDSIKINTVCAGGRIYIPSAFSPNNDGKNDRFVILGNGVRIIKSLRIYNRWGNLVFERKDFYPDDIAAAWNGMYKGVEAPAGTYVYFAEMECNANEIFTMKGTLTLIR